MGFRQRDSEGRGGFARIWSVEDKGNYSIAKVSTSKKRKDGSDMEYSVSIIDTLEQQVDALPGGKYKFTVSIMGGDAGRTDIYAYVKVNGETVVTAPLTISSYGNWDTAVTPAFTCADTDTVVVGVYVKCEGASNGAWGKIDDALLNSVK